MITLIVQHDTILTICMHNIHLHKIYYYIYTYRLLSPVHYIAIVNNKLYTAYYSHCKIYFPG